MSTYTDLTTFERDVWPQGRTVERRFVETAAEIVYNYINSCLAKCYSVPFDSPYPPLIVSISGIMTRQIAEWIHDYGKLPKIGDIYQSEQFLSPITLLKQLQEQELELLDSSGNVIGRASAVGAFLSTADQMHIFDQDHEFYHDVDRDRLDELADDRIAYP